jgi:N-formylglutamate deformylase
MDLPVTSTDPTPAPPFHLLRPARAGGGVIFASPHSGRAYPAEFVAAARLQGLALRRSEDSFVEELFATAPLHGAPLLAATFPRAFCDPNREAWELDPAMFEETLPHWVNTTSARVGAGLGTIARVVATGEAIYRRKLRFAEAETRVRQFWKPYHDALAGLIDEARARASACLLIDCHSMPVLPQATAVSGRRERGADFVLGDAHGTTCTPEVTDFVEATLTGFGYVVRRNDPYAGGYVTRFYGRPREGVHALQIEIGRSLYMDEARIEKLPHFAALRDHMDQLIASLVAAAPSLLPP